MRRRISYKKEPILHVHRYVVVVGQTSKDGWKEKFHYCMNKKEVKSCCGHAPKGAVVEVYRARHDFIEGWEKR